MDLGIAEARARVLMGQYGLQGKWAFRWLRESGVAGKCDFLDKELRLSRTYVLANDETIFLDTVNHLFAHALSDREAHCRIWVEEAAQLGVATVRDSVKYRDLLKQEVVPKGWRAIDTRPELWVYRNCLAPIKRRHSMSVGLR
jgi:hypothetical protein